MYEVLAHASEHKHQLRSLTNSFFPFFICVISGKRSKVLWYFYRECILMFISNITNHLVIPSELMSLLTFCSSSYFNNFLHIFFIFKQHDIIKKRKKGNICLWKIHFYDVIKNSFHIVFLPACLFAPSYFYYICLLLILIAFYYSHIYRLYTQFQNMFFLKKIIINRFLFFRCR